MMREIAALGVRPAVISHSTRTCLEVYRGFRHVVRNVYVYQLDPQRITVLVSRLVSCFENTRKDITSFLDTVETM